MELEKHDRTFGIQTFFSIQPTKKKNDEQIEGNLTVSKIGRKFKNILLVGDSKGKISVYHLGKEKSIDLEEPVRLLKGHPCSISVLSFDHSETLVGGLGVSSFPSVSECLPHPVSRVAKVWDLEHGRVVRTMIEEINRNGKEEENVGVGGYNGEIQFHPTREVLGCSGRGTVSLWDLRQKEKIESKNLNELSSFSFSPCGRWVVCGEKDSVVSLWDMRMKKMIKRFTSVWGTEMSEDPKGEQGNVGCLEFHPRKLLCCVGGIWGDRLSLLDLDNFCVASSFVSPYPYSPNSSQNNNCISMSFNRNGSNLFISQQEQVLSVSIYSEESIFSSPTLFNVCKKEAFISDVKGMDSDNFVCAVIDKNDKTVHINYGNKEIRGNFEGKEMGTVKPSGVNENFKLVKTETSCTEKENVSENYQTVFSIFYPIFVGF